MEGAFRGTVQLFEDWVRCGTVAEERGDDGSSDCHGQESESDGEEEVYDGEGYGEGCECGVAGDFY